MFSLIADLKGVTEVEGAASDKLALLMGWLNELIYIFDTERLLLRRFNIVGVSSTRLRVAVFSEVADLTGHHLSFLTGGLPRRFPPHAPWPTLTSSSPPTVAFSPTASGHIPSEGSDGVPPEVILRVSLSLQRKHPMSASKPSDAHGDVRPTGG